MEAVESDLFAARAMVVPVPTDAHGSEGVERQVGNPIKLSACPPRYDHVGPLPGADSRAVLTDAGFSEVEITAFLEAEVAQQR